MEYLDVYDENKKKTGKIIVRGEKPKENEHILLSIIFIKNSEGKYLIQKTSKEKGGHYSSTGGHVGSNEDSKTTILRELKEEVDEVSYMTKDEILNLINNENFTKSHGKILKKYF